MSTTIVFGVVEAKASEKTIFPQFRIAHRIGAREMSAVDEIIFINITSTILLFKSTFSAIGFP